MPAETHQHVTPADASRVLELLAELVGLDVSEAAHMALSELDLDGDLALLHLWDVTAEELGERALGDLDLDLGVDRPTTLGELAELFDAALQR
jgi:hypothetical protein